MHNILVTGASGQLGSELKELKPELFFADRNILDITDFKAVEEYCSKNSSFFHKLTFFI